MSVLESKIDFTGDSKRAGDYHQRHDDRDYSAVGQRTISDDDNIDDDDLSDTEPRISQLLPTSIGGIDTDGDIRLNTLEHKNDTMSTGSDSRFDDSTSSTLPSSACSGHLLRVLRLLTSARECKPSYLGCCNGDYNRNPGARATGDRFMSS